MTLVKDPEKGIGCTIKNAAGHILVHRIIEDGPIALTGVLRPGEQTVGEVMLYSAEEFSSCGRIFPCTVCVSSPPHP